MTLQFKVDPGRAGAVEVWNDDEVIALIFTMADRRGLWIMSPYDAMTAVTYPLGLKDDSERRNLMITFKRDPDAVQPFTMSEVQADIDAGLDTPACRKFDEIWNALGHASPPKRHRKKAQRSP